jgi:5'-phosphate synthase pdxT subunit
VTLVGVLALQGDVREHRATLERLDARTRAVRGPRDLEGLNALVMPGGESTAIAHLLTTSGTRGPMASAIDDGLPVLATCAGLILLARRVLDGRSDQWSFESLDVDVRRNGYGRQVASFEAEIDVDGVGPVLGVFIRAPRIERVGEGVEVLATHDHGDGAHPVLVRQGPITASSFHPELTDDGRVHRQFLDSLRTSAQ